MGPGLGSEDGGEGGNGGGEQSQAVGEAKEREGIVTRGTQSNILSFSKKKKQKDVRLFKG